MRTLSSAGPASRLLEHVRPAATWKSKRKGCVLAAVMTTLAAACGASAGPSNGASLKVTSTLDGHTALPLRIHWVASVSGGAVSEVDFLIDGQLGWVEHVTPYFYGDDGNWLVTSFLKPGRHIFTVRALGVGQQVATDTVQATTLAPPPPPAALAATWTRTVTPADVELATSGMPPPPGKWELRIDPMGWQTLDPTTTTQWGLFDVAYNADGMLQMRPTIEYPPYPNYNQGGFCADTDPLWAWTYSVGGDGSTLTLQPVGHDSCGDRIAILSGTWTRISG